MTSKKLGFLKLLPKEEFFIYELGWFLRNCNFGKLILNSPRHFSTTYEYSLNHENTLCQTVLCSYVQKKCAKYCALQFCYRQQMNLDCVTQLTLCTVQPRVWVRQLP